MYNSLNLAKTTAIFPHEDGTHKDWVIPPNSFDKNEMESAFTQMEDMLINPVIFIDFIRYLIVFRKLAGANK